MTEKEKIPDLAKATEAANDRSGPHEIKLAEARMAFEWALQNDHELYSGYRANVAMVLCDRLNIADVQTRHEVADAILYCIFSVVWRKNHDPQHLLQRS